ncbi:TolC family protein [Phascolarctobacterium sp.]|uniref:TolC family protein n=1 Tax=Phascolarctobacterium sp. TaxID=2049039 RepID=UPI002A830DDC|nr:TolC family protein [Phascolarctobacterium sp.]MDY5044859.1 TolC family protein [Phascolarctobacterium sp.]
MTRHKLSKRLLVLSAALTMLMSQSAFAGEVVELNLEDAMQRAFNTNPAITIAGYERDSARASYNAARSSRWITIEGNHVTRRGGNDDDQYTAGGWVAKNENTNQYVAAQNRGKLIGNTHSNTLTASMPIYTGGKLSGTIKQAKAGYLISEQGLQKAYNDMRTTVTNGYFDMLQADNMQKLGRESVERLADHLKNVEAQYEVGVVAKVDVLRSQVELANAKQSLIKAENAYQIAEANLNKIVGLPMDTQLKLDNLLVYTPYENDMQYCLDYAAMHRPELEQAKQNVEAAKGALRVAISGHMPQVAATASQNWNNKNWPGDENGNWYVGVSVGLNIFDSGVTTSKIHGAEADLAKAHETYRDTVDAVNLDVRSNYLNLREAEKRIDTTKLAVSQAEEDYRIAQLRYMNGVGTNTDVLDAQVALTDAKTNYLQAMYDYNTCKTNLETAIGVPMQFPTKVVVEPKVAEAEKAVNAKEAK